MRKAFMCSLCHNGILGGGLYLDPESVTYMCQKLTVDKKYKKLILPLNEIKDVTWKWVVFPIAVFHMNNGEVYKLLIFNKWRFEKWFREYSTIYGGVNMWKCPKCGREFQRINQGHYCGKAPETVNEYIALQNSETHSHLTELRNIILNNIPDVKERIAWSMPMYEREKRSVSFASCNRHVSFYTDHEILEKFKAQLSEFEIKKNAIYLPYNKTLPIELIKEIVKQCFEEK